MSRFEIITIVNYLAVLPAAAGLYHYNRFNPGFKALTLLFVAGFVAEISATFTAISFNNNMPVIYAYTFIEVWLMTYFICRISFNQLRIFPVFPLIVSTILLTELSVDAFAFPSVSRGVMSVGFIILLVRVVWLVALGMEIEKYKYIMVGLLLIYYCSSISYFTFARFIPGEPLYFLAIMHVVINALVNILTAIVLWKYTTSSSLA